MTEAEKAQLSEFGNLSRKLREIGGSQVILSLVSGVVIWIRLRKNIGSLVFVVKSRGFGDLLSPRVSNPWGFSMMQTVPKAHKCPVGLLLEFKSSEGCHCVLGMKFKLPGA